MWQLLCRSTQDGPAILTHCDQALVEKVAREFVERNGSKAVEVLRERAEIADGLADERSAEAWLDIANAAKRLLGQIGPWAWVLAFCPT